MTASELTESALSEALAWATLDTLLLTWVREISPIHKPASEDCCALTGRCTSIRLPLSVIRSREANKDSAAAPLIPPSPRLMPKENSTVLCGPIASLNAAEIGVSVHARLTALNDRRVRGTGPAMAVWRAGADSLETGLNVKVAAAAVRLRIRTTTTLPSRPNASPLFVEELISKGA